MEPPERGITTIRVVTYNTHACRGRDRKVSEARIAAVIEELQPDVVALQEIDQRRRRSRNVDQAELVAALTGMVSCFSPARRWAEGSYGNALLSRYPLLVEKDALLPRPRGLPIEPRSAQLVTLQLPQQQLQIINTHLGLLSFERIRQIRSLLSPEWFGAALHPLVLCGDLNSRSKSPEIRLLTQKLLSAHPNQATFPVHYPLWQLDYLFHTSQLTVINCFVHRTELARQASDHFPLVADFLLPLPSQTEQRT